MLVALGFLIAALLTLFLAPLYHRRAARLTTEKLKSSMPLTEAEIRADKDRLRAEYAIRIHKLELKVDEAADAAARQMVELNRRDATISALEGEVGQQRTSLEEHENARRVLEQTIMDRLPKVEHRLAEARKLLFQRDREIVGLSQSSEKQVLALEEATQINKQQTDEIHRLKAALNTRAARNREGLADPRFSGEVALRTEIESLRAKTRDQTALISRLQSMVVRAGPAGDGKPVRAVKAMNLNGDKDTGKGAMPLETKPESGKPALVAVSNPDDAGLAANTKSAAELRKLESENRDQAAEISRLKAALKTYEISEKDDRGIKDSKIALKARLSSLQALSEEQSVTIQKLRAEVAAGNERLARQAAYFMDEMRRLGSGTVPASTPARSSSAAVKPSTKRSLVERINDPRVSALARPSEGAGPSGAGADQGTHDPQRVSGFLKALDGQSSSSKAAASDAPPAKAEGEKSPPAQGKSGRRARLLDRITGLDKTSA